jgi:hypothetical protein
MPPPMVARWIIALTSVTFSVTPLLCQRVTGLVRDTISRQPIAGAVVMTQDAAGTTLAQASADGEGRFTLPRASGMARLRVIRIGFTPATVALDGSARDTTLEVFLDHIPPILATMAVADASLCPGIEPRGSAYDLWMQARAGLLSANIGRTDSSVSAAVLAYTRRRAADNDRIESETQTIHRGAASRPFGSLVDPIVVATRGFLSEETDSRTFYGPDDEILLDEAFPATHCFRIHLPDSAHAAQIGLEFDPAVGRDSLVDVHGVIWMDQAPLALRSLEFSYTGLEPAAMRIHAGGRVDFATVSNGVTFVTGWLLRLPVIGSKAVAGVQFREFPRRLRPDVRVTDISEVGGEVLIATWRDSTQYVEPVTGLAGSVVAADGRPLEGLPISIRERTDDVRTDARGGFSITTLMPGQYHVSVLDTTLSRYVDPRRVDTVVDVARGQTAELVMRLPPIEQASRGACGRGSDASIFGRIVPVRDSLKRPARLEATWDVPDGASLGTRYADVDTAGNFRLCGIARGTEVILRLTSAGLVADTTIHTLTPVITSLIWRASLRQPTVVATDRLISGIVVDSGSKPIRDALIERRGRPVGMSNDRGRFSFRVPAHDTAMLDVRRIGYTPARTPIMGGADTTIVVTLLPLAHMLGTVDVSVPRSASARLSGFEERYANRRHAGVLQAFITEEDIAKRGAALVTSMLGDAPGIFLSTQGGKAVIVGLDRAHGGRQCSPVIFLDGIRFDQLESPEGINAVGHAQDIVGIEIYPSITNAPVQYQVPNEWCAVVLIWRK